MNENSLGFNQINVLLLANAGILVEYNGTTILFDGLYGTKPHGFSNVPEECKRLIDDGKGVFEKIDYLVFTHLHPDHFSPVETINYLRKHSVSKVVFPYSDDPDIISLIQFLEVHTIPYLALDRTITQVFLTSNIKLKAIPTAHLDRYYHNVNHTCYIVTCDAKNILITADIDYTKENLYQINGLHLHGAFVNPLFLHALRTNCFFQGKLQCDKLIIYHLPFPEDDDLLILKKVEEDVSDLPNVVLLKDSLQMLTI